jgi:hypothetical protein
MSQRVTDEEVLNQIVIPRDRLNKQRHDLEQTANDKEVDVKARVSAHHLLGEMAAAIMKLHQETPAMLVVRHELPSNLPLP